MAYKLRFLPPADLDLIDIDEYLSANSPEKAKRFFELLNSHVASVKQMPRMYREYDAFPPYRVMVILDYIAFYVVEDDIETVTIHRILWGGRNLPAALNGAAPL